MGRPKKPVDENLIRELAEIQCTYEEISAITGLSKETLHRRFQTVINNGSEAGKKSLRRAQWESAVKNNNTTMQIWLGKQYLGQRDKSDVDLQGGLTVIWDHELDKL